MKEAYCKIMRRKLCRVDRDIEVGKMMSSEAIVYNRKAYAFFSRQHRMVFKLGIEFHGINYEAEISPFNPFGKRKSLSGWYELTYKDRENWEALTREALKVMKK